jgi:hypothetical protein
MMLKRRCSQSTSFHEIEKLKKTSFSKRKVKFSRCEMRDANAYSKEIKCSRKDSDLYLLMTTFDRECVFIKEMCSCIQRSVFLFSLYF